MRLIDVDAMNEELFYKEMGAKDTLITCETAFEMIKAQPIVFDCNEVIDRVIEILNRHNATFNAEANMLVTFCKNKKKKIYRHGQFIPKQRLWANCTI